MFYAFKSSQYGTFTSSTPLHFMSKNIKMLRIHHFAWIIYRHLLIRLMLQMRRIKRFNDCLFMTIQQTNNVIYLFLAKNVPLPRFLLRLIAMQIVIQWADKLFNLFSNQSVNEALVQYRVFVCLLVPQYNHL